MENLFNKNSPVPPCYQSLLPVVVAASDQPCFVGWVEVCKVATFFWYLLMVQKSGKPMDRVLCLLFTMWILAPFPWLAGNWDVPIEFFSQQSFKIFFRPNETANVLNYSTVSVDRFGKEKTKHLEINKALLGFKFSRNKLYNSGRFPKKYVYIFAGFWSLVY